MLLNGVASTSPVMIDTDQAFCRSRTFTPQPASTGFFGSTLTCLLCPSGSSNKCAALPSLLAERTYNRPQIHVGLPQPLSYSKLNRLKPSPEHGWMPQHKYTCC